MPRLALRRDSPPAQRKTRFTAKCHKNFVPLNVSIPKLILK